MKDKKLAIVCLAAALLGTFCLFLIQNAAQTEKKQIGEISQQDIGNELLVSGKVKNAYLKNGNLAFELCDIIGSKCIPSIIFKKELNQMTQNGNGQANAIENGMLLEAKFQVNDFNGPELVLKDANAIRTYNPKE